MENVYGYIRVSTQTQADKGYGLDVQENAICKYCADNDLNLVHIYADKGISGAMGDKGDLSYRHELYEMLCSMQKVTTIIVMNTSRLWRDDASKVFICLELRKKGGNIVSIEQPSYSIYSKDPSDFLMNSIVEIFDEYERLAINMKLAKGRSTKASKGLKPAGNLPIGYKYSEDGRAVLLDEDYVPLVKKMFRLRCNGWSYGKIATEINAEYRTRRGAKFQPDAIRKIIINPFYKGILVHEQKQINGKHKQIISVNDWEDANSISRDD